MKILALDPGTTESAWIVWDGVKAEHAFENNYDIRERLSKEQMPDHDLVAIEMIASYGMAVGKETFETCVWIGRFLELSYRPVIRVLRKDIKLHLCQSPRAKDANVRQALIDKYGAPGTKKNPGPTYGISGHMWAALAVADYALASTEKGALL